MGRGELGQHHLARCRISGGRNSTSVQFPSHTDHSALLQGPGLHHPGCPTHQAHLLLGSRRPGSANLGHGEKGATPTVTPRHPPALMLTVSPGHSLQGQCPRPGRYSRYRVESCLRTAAHRIGHEVGRCCGNQGEGSRSSGVREGQRLQMLSACTVPPNPHSQNRSKRLSSTEG